MELILVENRGQEEENWNLGEGEFYVTCIKIAFLSLWILCNLFWLLEMSSLSFAIR